jgi:hypothetical protein
VTKCDGEASANNRKAKLIFFYEWVVNGEWEGSIKDSENYVYAIIMLMQFGKVNFVFIIIVYVY